MKSVLWQFTLFLRNLFCRDLPAFAWKKIEPKIVLGGGKMTNGMHYSMFAIGTQTK